MSDRARLFGFWMPVHDRQSAQEAIRMAGLPVLVMGAGAGLRALISATQMPPDLTVAAWSGALALLLVIVSLRIRAGHAAWVPIMVPLFIAVLVANAVMSAMSWSQTRQDWIASAQMMASWIVPLFCLALIFSGLRAWRWLRANELGSSF